MHGLLLMLTVALASGPAADAGGDAALPAALPAPWWLTDAVRVSRFHNLCAELGLEVESEQECRAPTDDPPIQAAGDLAGWAVHGLRLGRETVVAVELSRPSALAPGEAVAALVAAVGTRGLVDCRDVPGTGCLDARHPTVPAEPGPACTTKARWQLDDGDWRVRWDARASGCRAPGPLHLRIHTSHVHDVQLSTPSMNDRRRRRRPRPWGPLPPPR